MFGHFSAYKHHSILCGDTSYDHNKQNTCIVLLWEGENELLKQFLDIFKRCGASQKKYIFILSECIGFFVTNNFRLSFPPFLTCVVEAAMSFAPSIVRDTTGDVIHFKGFNSYPSHRFCCTQHTKYNCMMIIINKITLLLQTTVHYVCCKHSICIPVA